MTTAPNPKGTMCAHGCGAQAPAGAIGAYCDRCYADGCLAGPDGICRYTIHEHEWSEIRHARFTGNPHRECLDCGDITLDLAEGMTT